MHPNASIPLQRLRDWLAQAWDLRNKHEPDLAREVLDRCLATGTTALLVHADAEAMAIVQRCEARGISVPGDLSVVASRASELKPKTVGNIHWDREKKTAVIRVLDPADYTLPFEEMLRDIEFTVVHELIHLEMVPVLSDLQRTEENRREEEHAVNHMAEALLKLDRGR